jgi:hypothetical protein
MGKRGQVTIFIIIAILLIAIVALFFLFKDKINVFRAPDNPVFMYVESCITETGEDGILYIAKNGGYVYAPSLSSSEGVPYYYHNDKSYVPALDRVENQLSEYVEMALSACTDEFGEFPELEVEEGEVSCQTKIQENEVVINVNYPLVVKKGEDTTRFEDFRSVKINSRIYTMHDSINKIIERQIGNEQICLSCISKIVDEEGFKIDMTSTEEGIVFILVDENSKIKDVPVEWKFINKYE